MHIAAALFYLLFKRENLIAPMFTGRKDDPGGRFEAIPGSRLSRAIVVLAIAAAVVVAAVTLL